MSPARRAAIKVKPTAANGMLLLNKRSITELPPSGKRLGGKFGGLKKLQAAVNMVKITNRIKSKAVDSNRKTEDGQSKAEKKQLISIWESVDEDGSGVLDRGELRTVRAPSGRLSALSVSHSKSVLYGGFVWARRALNSPKRRFPTRAGADEDGENARRHRARRRDA